MGAAAVGKSALAWRYTQNEFREYYDPTISDTFQKNLSIDGKQITVDILDTAGMEDYQPLEDDWINNKDSILLVYSVDIESSLYHLRNIWDKIRNRYFTGKMPTVVLVGNKVDLKRNIAPE
mmetsp:Transcript_33502/g.6077  ORF Transcript_33502/g.6077 Transcript_33502/m.6077 type:complete len:121 (+) Transcript_33502:294-656(+)